MEDELDTVEGGKMEWVDLLDGLYEDLEKKLKKAKNIKFVLQSTNFVDFDRKKM